MSRIFFEAFYRILLSFLYFLIYVGNSLKFKSIHTLIHIYVSKQIHIFIHITADIRTYTYTHTDTPLHTLSMELQG